MHVLRARAMPFADSNQYRVPGPVQRSDAHDRPLVELTYADTDTDTDVNTKVSTLYILFNSPTLTSAIVEISTGGDLTSYPGEPLRRALTVRGWTRNRTPCRRYDGGVYYAYTCPLRPCTVRRLGRFCTAHEARPAMRAVLDDIEYNQAFFYLTSASSEAALPLPTGLPIGPQTPQTVQTSQPSASAAQVAPSTVPIKAEFPVTFKSRKGVPQDTPDNSSGHLGSAAHRRDRSPADRNSDDSVDMDANTTRPRKRVRGETTDGESTSDLCSGLRSDDTPLADMTTRVVSIFMHVHTALCGSHVQTLTASASAAAPTKETFADRSRRVFSIAHGLLLDAISGGNPDADAVLRLHQSALGISHGSA